MTTIVPRPRPDAAAQMRHLPLDITSGMAGFRIAHAAGTEFVSVPDQGSTDGHPIYFDTPERARIVMREAQGATAALFARIRNGVA